MYKNQIGLVQLPNGSYGLVSNGGMAQQNVGFNAEEQQLHGGVQQAGGMDAMGLQQAYSLQGALTAQALQQQLFGSMNYMSGGGFMLGTRVHRVVGYSFSPARELASSVRCYRTV